MAQYIGVSGVARTVAAQHIGVGGVARTVAAGFFGAGGVARKIAGAGYALVNITDGGDAIYTTTGVVPYETPNSALPLQGSYARVQGTLEFTPDPTKHITQYGMYNLTANLPDAVHVDIDLEDVSIGQEYELMVPAFISSLENKNSWWTVTKARLHVTFNGSSLNAYILYNLNYAGFVDDSTLDVTDLRLPGTDSESTTACDMAGQLKFYRE